LPVALVFQVILEPVDVSVVEAPSHSNVLPAEITGAAGVLPVVMVTTLLCLPPQLVVAIA
jgi:hypothetical protein